MTADNQYQLSVIQPQQQTSLTKAARQVVPQFLQKLYEMVSNASTNHLIKWSDTGDSFIVLDHERVARDVLPRWFKHGNFASFVRQLNMYGFHKIPHLQQGVLKSESETELWNFEHPSFRRNQPDLLCLITRKKQAPDRVNGDAGHGDGRDTFASITGGDSAAGTVMDINTIMSGIASLKHHQATISSELNDLKTSNQALWQEALAARERHDKHQQTINKILKFLAGVFGNPGSPHHKGSASSGSPHSVIPRRRQPLMIEDVKSKSPLTSVALQDSETVTPNTPRDGSRKGASIHVVDAPTSSAFEAEETRSPSVKPSILTPVTEASTPFTEQPSYDATVDPSQPYSRYFSAPTQTNSIPSSSFVQPSNMGASSSTSSHTNDMNMLTSVSQQQNAKQEAMLQSILNSPGQLQKLFNMMQSQQGMQLPPVPASHSNMDDPFTINNNSELAQRPISPFSLSGEVPHPDPQTLSLLKADDGPNYEPLLENTSQLQKKYHDSASISSDIDAMQASIESLIHDLGLDPNQITTFDNSQDHDDPVLSTGAGLTACPPPVGGQTPISLPSAETLPNAIPDFDIEAFLRELSKQQADAHPSDFTNDDKATSLDPSVSVGPQGHFSAFVDEVNSNSDVSSPPATRVTLTEEPEYDVPMGVVGTSKKGRKRKSDVDTTTTGADLSSSKPKRKR